MRGRHPNPRGESLTRRQKHVFVIVGCLMLLIVAGLSVWATAGPDRYGRSGNGCVNVVEPSSTGGAVLHQCGPAARALCRRAAAAVSRPARPATT